MRCRPVRPRDAAPGASLPLARKLRPWPWVAQHARSTMPAGGFVASRSQRPARFVSGMRHDASRCIESALRFAAARIWMLCGMPLIAGIDRSLSLMAIADATARESFLDPYFFYGTIRRFRISLSHAPIRARVSGHEARNGFAIRGLSHRAVSAANAKFRYRCNLQHLAVRAACSMPPPLPLP